MSLSLQISRIQNPTLRRTYAFEKRKVEKLNENEKGVTIERELWHGTTSDVVDDIIAGGLNRSYNGKNGANQNDEKTSVGFYFW